MMKMDGQALSHLSHFNMVRPTDDDIDAWLHVRGVVDGINLLLNHLKYVSDVRDWSSKVLFSVY